MKSKLISSEAQVHLPGDHSVLVNPCFEVFILLLENLDLLLQDDVLFCLEREKGQEASVRLQDR